MQQQAGSFRFVRFGPFEADLHAGELYRHGLKVRMKKQAFPILAMLLERPGEVVTRAELRQRLWRADASGDFDQGLDNTMKRLWRVLDDSAGHARFIETLPGDGYRFIAPVTRADRAALADAASPEAMLRRARMMALVLLAIFAAAASFLAWQRARTHSGPPTGKIVLILPRVSPAPGQWTR